MPQIFRHLDPGEVMFCAFPQPGEHGHAPPEMTKFRRVVVLSPRFRKIAPQTVLVVPLSTTVPKIVDPFHYQIQGHYWFLKSQETWVKADMLTCVSVGRLKAFYKNGKAVRAALDEQDSSMARRAVAIALGLLDRSLP